MKPKEEKVLTNIEADVKFKGSFKFKENLLVKGRIEGIVESRDGKIEIEQNGQVEGKILAKTIDNRGLIKGKVDVLEEFNLFAGGTAEGEINVKTLLIEKGAFFNGNCKMEK